MWVAVNEDALTKAAKEGKTSLTYTYIFDWYHTEEGSKELVQTQKLTIVINLAGVKLVDEEEKEVWNQWIYKEVKAEAPSTDDPSDEPADKPATKPSDKDEEPKTGITATAIVATATAAMISLAGAVIGKK